MLASDVIARQLDIDNRFNLCLLHYSRHASSRFTISDCCKVLESESLRPGKVSDQVHISSSRKQTLEAFLSEAGLSEDAATTQPGDWTIETIIEEKRQFDTSLHFEKKSNEENQGWSLPAPSNSVAPNLPNSSNVLVSLFPNSGGLLKAFRDMPRL